jgi:predicted metal-binding membrane protein
MRTRHRTFEPYVAAHQRAHSWAVKAMRYRSAAQFTRAAAAVEKVQHWLSKIAVLEAGGAAGLYNSTGANDACKE